VTEVLTNGFIQPLSVNAWKPMRNKLYRLHSVVKVVMVNELSIKIKPVVQTYNWELPILKIGIPETPWETYY
jgi:hypothetical protein